jgi:hypothetical protein
VSVIDPISSPARGSGARKGAGSLRAALLAGVLVPLWGCGDLDTGPPVELRSEDPVVSLHFSDRLPTFAALVERWAPQPGLERLSEEWQTSWEEAESGGPAARRAVVEAGSALLVDAVPNTALNEAFRQVDEAIAAAEEVLGARIASDVREGHPELTGPVVEAARHRDQALQARTVGDREVQLRHTLLAADLLRGTTAEPLALLFIEQGELELRRISELDPYPSVTRDRARRLLLGAREAIETGNPVLGLQRAWYAVGLLKGADPRDGPPGDHDGRDMQP